jgi:hypothetical protein
MISLVDRRFHYIRGGEGREELYELESDPDETRDLAGSPELAPVLEEFRRSLRPRDVASVAGPGDRGNTGVTEIRRVGTAHHP